MDLPYRLIVRAKLLLVLDERQRSAERVSQECVGGWVGGWVGVGVGVGVCVCGCGCVNICMCVWRKESMRGS